MRGQDRIVVVRLQLQLVMQAELRNHRVNGTDLHTPDCS